VAKGNDARDRSKRHGCLSVWPAQFSCTNPILLTHWLLLVKNIRTQTQRDYYAVMELTKEENESAAKTAAVEKDQRKRSAQVRDVVSHVSA